MIERFDFYREMDELLDKDVNFICLFLSNLVYITYRSHIWGLQLDGQKFSYFSIFLFVLPRVWSFTSGLFDLKF